MDELACINCMWCGDRDSATWQNGDWWCPVCGNETEFIDSGYHPYQKPFNWNKA